MKQKIPNIIIFILSAVSLIVSLILFYNTAIFTDEFNTTLATVYGGELELLLAWSQFLFLFVVCALSFVNLLRRNHSAK